ncbi:MAG: IS481 family transposase [Myxococcales bacterium]|nr:IS481 family transposase [Myxococcales bacterium]
MGKAKKPHTGPEHPVEYKLAAVQERLRGTKEHDVAKAFGVSPACIAKWLKQFREHGPVGLKSKRSSANREKKKPNPAIRDKVVLLKQLQPELGTRRISDALARFEALGVSEQEVRRILHEAGLIDTPKVAKEREHEPRRFERASVNQLWQSDIFTFRLRRAERLYVCIFMDDHSRFVVGHSMAHHQKSALVMEAFERGAAAYGYPAEVLTDNGRQYTVWRGKTEFEEELKRRGVQHIRSRPQHPQTLGKVERFWKTLWDEFLGRTVFAHAVDAQRRLEHYINHYNYQRPHQSLDGLVPADRFFKAAAHVRAEIERAIAQNEMRLALEQPLRKPFYVVGQLGEQRLSIAASATGLEVNLGGKSETIPLTEDTDGTHTAHRFTASIEEPADAALADDEDGSGRGREEPRDAGAVGALGREAGDDGDRGGEDLAGLLLPARDQGAQRDAARAGARRGWGSEPGRDGTARADQTARGEAREGGGRVAAHGAPALRAAKTDELGAGEDAPWPAAESDNLLDAGWAEKLALLDDDEAEVEVQTHEERDDGSEPGGRFDPHAGWRERGPERWERKLAGADATSDNLSDGEEGPTSELYAGARAPSGPGAAQALWPHRRGAGGDDDGDRRGDRREPIAQSLSDDLAPGIAAMLEELTPKPAGRPAKPAREAELEAENEQLRDELEVLKERTAAVDRMLTVVSGYATGKKTLPRPRGKKNKPEGP